jgi:hypothetical protein
VAELFRYIQHAFVVPSTTQPIDIGRQSDLQDSLRDAISRDLPSDRVRSIADAFIAKHFSSPQDDPFQMRSQLLSFGKLLAPPVHGTDAVKQLIASTFGSDAPTLAGSDPFLTDKALLDDILVSVKITTAFDRVNAHQLVAMRQTIAFIEDLAAGRVSDEPAEDVRAILRRPIRIPSEFVKPLTAIGEGPTPPPPPDPAIEAAARQRSALVAEQQHLKRAYEAIMSLPPDQFELKPVSIKADRATTRNAAGRNSGKEATGSGGCGGGEGDAGSAAPSFLAIPAAAVEHLGSDVRKTLEKAHIDIAGAPVAHVITAIKRQWEDVSQQLAPYQAPAPARVFRLGAHLFAVQDSTATTAPATGEAL